MSRDVPSGPRTKPPAQRHDDLIGSAERIFLEKGLEQATIEEITQGAGVSKGTFYLHFSSKADVIDALRGRFVQVILDGIVAEVATKEQWDFRGKLEAWCKAFCIGYLNAAPLHHLVFVAAPPPTRDGLARNSLIDHLTDLLTFGAAETAWSLEDPQFTAVFLFNALHGVVNQASEADGRSARHALVSAVKEHALRSVGLPAILENE